MTQYIQIRESLPDGFLATVLVNGYALPDDVVEVKVNDAVLVVHRWAEDFRAASICGVANNLLALAKAQ